VKDGNRKTGHSDISLVHAGGLPSRDQARVRVRG
jgi:hypothetical protein